MPRLVKIDGNLSLSGTEKRCEQVQRGGFQLTLIEFSTEILEDGTVVQVNKATFDDALSVDILNELKFVEAEDSEKLDAIKGKAAGFTFICDTKIYVEDKLQRVVVFGKQV